VYDHVEGRPGAARDFDDAVAGLVHEALAEPGDDLFGHLARAELDGRALQRQELLSFANLLLAAGRGTLVDAIAGSLWHLATHPNDRRRLARHPEFVPRAVEEFLRYVSPLPHIGRIVRRPATVEGARIDAGEQLSLGFAFANRDPAVFAEADACRLGRDPNPHVAFGHGPHLCLGAPLARAELRVVLTAWLAAIPEFGLAGDARLRVVELGSRSLASGFDALPLRVGAGG
jgi:cytochrome P450